MKSLILFIAILTIGLLFLTYSKPQLAPSESVFSAASSSAVEPPHLPPTPFPTQKDIQLSRAAQLYDACKSKISKQAQERIESISLYKNAKSIDDLILKYNDFIQRCQNLK